MTAITGTVVDYADGVLTIKARFDNRDFITNHAVRTAEIRLNDGVHISAEQRAKIYAVFRDIAEYTGYDERDVKVLMKAEYLSEDDERKAFSLSDTTMTNAGEFIDFLLSKCLERDIPLTEPPTVGCYDLEKIMFACLMNKKCCVCGRTAELHHIDAVGMGGNRKTMHHEGKRVMALCREHHTEYHGTGTDFFEKYHVIGIPLNQRIAKKYRVKF